MSTPEFLKMPGNAALDDGGRQVRAMEWALRTSTGKVAWEYVLSIMIVKHILANAQDDRAVTLD
jgi:hypothetical protein